ncbi:uncharacterized protein MELLADRAFT_92915 [Melampsora larici-populina 98AG31]|uniref:Uncharacterized protein n=1 Tax=Melampsora larici-populina (strain 98AG31 / pathotype 3-4-7) TaxID=747676 RepID=F4S389_MELLP|nr:uncharacterized protein MELLADRAFT_92915 [Melampsora larici-populina 98AG31]EGG00952.1 hypothetical protein MELLADRAFT_92915 [Melampsora larici-populina 98AG31]
MLEDLTRTRLSHRRKISTDAIPALREKLGTGSNKAVNWIGNQIRKVRRGSDSESDESGSLWGTSFEIYPDEPLGPATALAEGYVPLSRFHSQKRSTDLTNRNHTVQADHIFSLDQCKLDERQPLIESETLNPPSTSRTIEGPRKRRQKTLDPEEPRRLLAPVELYDRPWSGMITDDSQSLLGTSDDPYRKYEDHSSNPKPTSSMRKAFQFPARRPPKRSETDLSTHTPSTKLQNWFNKPKESNFGFGASNRRDTEKTFGSTYKNPSRHATTPSQSKLSFRVLLPHP